MSVAPVLLSVRDVADATHLSEYTIRGFINSGKLKAIRIGTSIRVKPSDLEEWINTHEQVTQ